MKSQIEHAVQLLKAGELVAFPTETVYGLGADAANPDAVAKIFAAKGRPADHPLIVHLAGVEYLNEWAVDIPESALVLARAFWPGPLTMILKRAPKVPYAVTGGQETVGVRVPSHPLARELLVAYAKAGGGKNGMSGIAAPSANRFGRISPTQAGHVKEELGGAVSLVLDGGACEVGIESTIIDLTLPAASSLRLLRPGHISLAEIEEALGIVPACSVEAEAALHTNEASPQPRVSGSLDAHYAPVTPLLMVPSYQLQETVLKAAKSGQRCAVLACSGIEVAGIAKDGFCRLGADSQDYARAMYAALRQLDSAGYDLIVVEKVPQTPLWAAINDRLRRAVCGAGKTEEA